MSTARDKLWASGHDETVEVNQRALIDKVLARYSGEFTVFRELLQNSDDAQSKAVEIRFETQAYLDLKSTTRASEASVTYVAADDELPDLKTTNVHSWTFKNNGIIFRDEDWSRLKKIAEGNPDEEKIGAFGVGFYSLFSVTEEPFVTSGGKPHQWMGFYWKDKKDQLFARRGHLPEDEGDPKSRTWTSFGMILREPAPIPLAFDFTRFLASSLTFMRTLNEVSVYFDEKRLVKLNKASGLPRDLGVPKGLNCRSPTGIMTVDGMQCTPLYIQAQVMKWIYSSGTEKKRPPPKMEPNPKAGGSSFFSSLFSSLSGVSTPHRVTTPTPLPVVRKVDQRAINETSVSLSIYSASVQVRLTKQLSSEIHRSTKKNPPARTKFELIYTAKDEYDASVEEDAKQPEATGSIFQGLRADIEGLGAARVFIGHSTAQSTGIGGHVAARFIPTVERESIDFVDRNVAVWNKELLAIGGLLSRSVYELELQNVREQWEATDDEDIRKRLMDRVVHALKFFRFYNSTPSPEVSSLMEAAFFVCSPGDRFPLISTKGVRNVADIRLPDPAFAGFLKDLPTVPEEIMDNAPGIIFALQARGAIKSIRFEDVLKELRSRPLNESEFIACLNWWISIYKESDRARLLPVRTQIIDAIILTTGTENGDKVIPMASFKTFLNPKSSSGSIPADGPFPDSLLPPSISKAFKPELLSSCFPWTELSAVSWIAFISQTEQLPAEHNMDINPEWAERVITYITRTWPTLTAGSKAEIHQLLKTKSCIPTSAGMKVASDAYFPNVSLFRDLPIVTFPSGLGIKGTLDKVLQELGVRRHVDLQLLFNRMIKTNEWTVADLTKYLASVKDSMSQEEYERLKATSAFLAENAAQGPKPKRYKASQLYEPLDVFRSLKLPIIDWGTQTKWRSASEEAKFLFGLGLQRYPLLEVLINLCAGHDAGVQIAALKYLIDNLDTKYQNYDPYQFKDVAFVPALKGSSPCQGTIQEVYSGPWASAGFMVLQPAYLPHATKLKIMEHPSATQLISLLETKPPVTTKEAEELFRLLAARVSDFRSSDFQRLSNIPFVPIQPLPGTAGPTKQWLPPSLCYLGGRSDAAFHSKLFTFVDFGQSANAFLAACGSRNQPTVEEIAKILLNDPKHFFELANGPINFLEELRNLAVNSRMLSSATMQRMKRSSILLGCQRKSRTQRKSDDDLDEDEWDIVYELKKPLEIIIADDTSAYQFFGDKLYTAPQEDIIEAFYATLGSPRLSQVVKEEHKTTVELHDSKLASETRALILERLPLFLHEHHAASLAVSYSWISSPRNFVVRAFGKLTMVKHLRYENQHLSRTQDASAVAQKTRYGTIELWIAGNSQVDMYEVATSLNQFIFKSPKANDALLFMTILSTDLRSLKRRGYNVDRILRQQKDARAAAETARIAKEKEVKEQEELEKSQPLLPGGFHEPETSNIASEPPIQHTAPPLPEKDYLPQQNSVAPSSTNSPDASTNHFQNIKRKLGLGSAAAQLEKMTNIVQRNVKPHLPTPSISGEQSHSPGEAGPGVTPLSNISKNIDLAINACRPESGDLLQNREHMQRVKESMNDGYCDISGRKGNLRHIGEMGPVKIFISEEVPTDPDVFMETKYQSIARFIHIMTPLARIYELPIINLHIFFDLQGGIIAFNRNGSIFLNLRYFEEWHDADVKARKLSDAFISWYFTIAHEIAHNLVQPHNSEHEFYFSAICERHFIKLAQQLNAPLPTSL